jgi:DNA polymerase-3 subunit delta'
MSVWDSLSRARAVEGLRRQLAEGEVAQAWLLLGPPSSPRDPVARAMAAALSCPVEPRIGCGVCSTCQRVLRRRYPDVHYLAPEGSVIPVDAIREVVLPEASRSPFEGTTKVFVIEDADLMNDQAQSALLKTLEEPQPDTVFILSSDDEDELLETIRSRCRIVRLEAIPEPLAVESLRDEGVSQEAATVAVRLEEGDVGRARSMLLDERVRERRARWDRIPQRLHSAAEALDAAAEMIDEARAAGREQARAQRKEIEALAESMGEGRGTAAARNALAMRHRREMRRVEEDVLAEALRTVGGFYRDVVAVRAGASEVVTNLDRLETLREWASSSLHDTGLIAAAERCVAASAALAQNTNVALTLEAALCDLVRLAPPPAGGGEPRLS